MGSGWYKKNEKEIQVGPQTHQYTVICSYHPHLFAVIILIYLPSLFIFIYSNYFLLLFTFSMGGSPGELSEELVT